ncbi:chromate transporter [Chromobacterium amazonense]|uniref:chromate transporter n=1 Tax=Chromobacterium amazonense TaxID=1382803 RepID=UPI0009F32ABA|nr:chromate transporter [Chromobacterium amazonense]
MSIKQETTADSAWEIFLVFLRLGLTSFGGPVAHVGYFRSEFVMHRAWLSERSFADLVALCQFLPGPSSSQLGIALGLSRAGARGAAAAWLGFTLPSALALALLARGMTVWGQTAPAGALHGLKIVAVAVVAQAVWGMARSLCADAPRFGIAAVSAILALTMMASGVLAAISVKHVSRRWNGFGEFARKAPYFSSGLIALVGLYVGYHGWMALA